MVNPKTVVVQMPSGWGDAATDIASQWFEEAITVLQAQGFTVKPLRKSECLDGPFHEALTSTSAIGFTGVGHGGGSPQRFTGYQMKDLLIQGNMQDAQAMKDRVCYFLSCEIGRELIPWLVENGMAGAIGYNESFWLVSGDDAKYFKYCSNAVVEALAKALTMEMAWKKSQETFDYWIKYLSTIPNKKQIIDLLVADKNCQILCGNIDANWIQPPEPEPQVKCYWCEFQEARLLVVKHMILEHHAYECPPGVNCQQWFIELGKIFGLCR
jgi:hypothetical protein